jgi:hypothetical protein
MTASRTVFGLPSDKQATPANPPGVEPLTPAEVHDLTAGPAEGWAGHGTARWEAVIAAIPIPGPRPRRTRRDTAALRAYAESQYALMLQQAAARNARQLGVL